MKKRLLYILLHLLSAVLADWITVEHDFEMCDQVVPSDVAAFHIDDDGISYSSSPLVKNIQNVKHEPPTTIVNVTMWGCTFDCDFSFLVKLNRDDQTVSSYTEKNSDNDTKEDSNDCKCNLSNHTLVKLNRNDFFTVSSYTEKDSNNYKCNLSDHTMNLLPTPKITYKALKPNPDYVFPIDLTLKYCSEGIHPDKRTWAIPATDNVAECIDHLTGSQVGTYAAALQFGSGSAYRAEGYGVATYHMIDLTNKLFNYWESHHRGFHDALDEVSLKMTTNNLKELAPPSSPEPKVNLHMDVILPAINSVVESRVNKAVNNIYGEYSDTKPFAGICGSDSDCTTVVMEKIAELNQHSQNPNMERILASLNQDQPKQPKQPDNPPKKDTVDNLGFFTTNMVNLYFLPNLMSNVHESFTSSGQTYSDISSHLSATREHLLYHFKDTLHNNLFAGNKSSQSSFTVHQGANYDQLLANDDDVYNTIKTSTYNTLTASIISVTLQNFKVEICDSKPSFCGQDCDDDGHTYYCPTIGKDNCVITATDGQINELKSLRDTSDICSNDGKNGWNITHNSNCKATQFTCQ